MFNRKPIHLLLLIGVGLVAFHSESANAGDKTPSDAFQTHTRAEVVINDSLQPPGTDAAWHPVDLPDEWRPNHPADRKFAWYRFPFDVSEVDSSALAIFLPKVNMSAEVWLGKHQLGLNSSSFASPASAIPNDFNRPLFFEVPFDLGGPAPDWIYVRLLRHAHHYGDLGPIETGPVQILSPRYRKAFLYRIDLARLATVLVTLSSLFAGILWLATKRDPINGTFAWTAACCAIVSLNYWIRDLPFDRWVWERLIYAALSGFAIGVALWSRRLVLMPESQMDRALRIYLVLLVAFIALLPLEHFYPTINYVNGVSTMIPIYAGFLVLRNQNSLTRSERTFYFMGSIFAIGLCSHDLAMQFGWLPADRPFLFTYVMPVMITIFAGSLVARFSSSLDRAENLAANLERRVDEKVAELAANYARLSELEREHVLLLERQRLTREMHDGLGGQLVSALALVESGEAPARTVATAIRTALADLRTVIDSLDPRIVDYGMLFGLLRGRIEPLFEADEIEIGWHVGDLPTDSSLSSEQNLHLLRILQEAFSNAVRHAKPSRIDFSVESSDDTLTLTVEDDGPGLGKGNPNGRGLPNMRTRANALGAELTITNSKRGGAQVEIRLPVKGAT